MMSRHYFTKAFLVLAMTLLVSAQTQTDDELTTGSPTNFTVTDAPSFSPDAVQLPTLEPTTAPTYTFDIDTDSPTAAATEVPETEPPTAMETSQPTLSPTVMATTLAPTAMATTTAPTVMATTTAPTDSPSMAATTSSPTEPAATIAPPIAVITGAPSEGPSAGPVAVATGSPSMAPSDSSEAPSVFINTSSPTPLASAAPSGAPSVTPIIPTTSSPTETASEAPTETVSERPSSAPSVVGATSAPTVPVTPLDGTVENLVMTMVGMNQVMTPDAITFWQTTTEEHISEWYKTNPYDLKITDLVTSVTLIQQQIVQVRRLRGRALQTTSIEIKYDQELSYKTVDESAYTLEAVSLAPFDTQGDRDAYLEALQTDAEFSGVTAVSDVGEGGGSGTKAPIVEPEKDGGGDGLGMGVIIGIVVGCIAFVGIVGGVGYFVSQRGDDGGYTSTNNGKQPPSNLDMDMRPDDVSTLAEPNVVRNSSNRQSGVGGTLSAESVQGGYGDQSVATVDYDYSKAYGGGGENSVSSAGGTFGSQTHTQAAGGAVALGASGTGGPLDGNFPESGSQFRGQNASVREELVDIYAPPGKLGVVIDTPDDGAPVVHAVKDSSVISDKLQVGDKLVAVDDEDVRSMTAIKVSKLISRKSANASRKLSIIRTVVVDE